MSTQQPSRPVITPAMREQAAKQPNTWLYVVDPIFTDPNAEVPPWGFIGGYRVDERGELTDDFSPNPNYRPSPVALRLPAPANDLERALQLTTTGYAQGQLLLSALLDAELILFAQPQGSGIFTTEHESGRRQLQVFTSDSYLPPKWTTWQRMSGRELAGQQLAGIDVQINPASAVKARIPGEDLLKIAAMPRKGPAALEAAPATPAPVVQGAAPASPPVGTPTQRVNGATIPPANAQTPPSPPPPTPAPTPPPPDATQPVPPKPTTVPDPTDSELGTRFLGSMLAGAIGDALGSAVEFYPVDQIRSRFGEQGVADYDRNSERPGEFTDDTQMTLFTLEGLIRGHIAKRNGKADSPLPALQLAYLRWLHTQGYAWSRAAGPFAGEHPEPNGWLIKQRDLFAVRSPNSSCITALREFSSAGTPGTFEHAINDSQDCGGVVRAAPVAIWSDEPKEVFELAAASAALTYSHPNGYLPAGVLAALVHRLLRGESLTNALEQARSLLTGYAGHEDTERALQAAVDLASGGKPTPEQIKDSLGGGWTGHEALAIAVCAALSSDGIAPGVMIAVNHSGDSDSTGAICGNIVGAMHGAGSLPGIWLRDLKQRETVEALVKDALVEFGAKPLNDDNWAQRYPALQDTSSLVFTSVLPAAKAPEPTAPEAKAPEAKAPEPKAPDVKAPEAKAPAEPKPPAPAAKADRRSRFLGCMLGGAVGDALGYPIENESLESIRAKYGRTGLTEFVDAHRPGGSISDDTQMTLFTLDGLIRAGIQRRLHGETEPATQVQHAYQRWLHTQGFDWKDAAGPTSASGPDGWLIQRKGLFVRRTPGTTSIQALHGYASGKEVGSFSNRVNDSKGCGGVMRAAPAALWSDDTAQVFQVGALTAVLTHGHPSGFLPAGALAVIVQQLLQDQPLPTAVGKAMTELATWEGHEETTTALRKAVELASNGAPSPELIHERLGSGNVGEEALAIAVCAAMSHQTSFPDAVILAANHSGASDSTAAICGNIMGAAHTASAIPERWRNQLELRAVIVELAEDAVREFGPNPSEEPIWFERYPVVSAEVAAEVAAETTGADAEFAAAVEVPAPVEVEATPDTAAPVEEAPVEASVEEAPEPVSATVEPVSAPVEATPAPVDEVPAVPVEEPQPVEPAPVEAVAAQEAADPASSDDGLSDEEFRLLAAWRKFRDGDDDTPTDLSQGLHKLLAEAFGEERAAQLVGEAGAEAEEAQPPAESPVRLSRNQRLAGCVLGGAAGDALGAPWTFAELSVIRRENPEGVRHFTEFFGRRGACTSLSQQSVFVLDGLIRASLCARLRGVDSHTYPPGMVRLTLQHWLWAQGARFEPTLALGVLAKTPALCAQRFPDEASLTALTQYRDAREAPTASHPPNAARTATATARGAVVGFHAPTPEAAVSLGAEVAVVTHGHPDGYLPAGAVAGLVAAILTGQTIAESVRTVAAELELLEGSEATVGGLRTAMELATDGPVTPEALAKLGTGWNAPEALAIAVCAALAHPNDFDDAVSLAATHSGNSAATAMICGSLLGAARGVDAVPGHWLEDLELRDVLRELSDDEARIEAEVRTGESTPEWAGRYLG